MKKGKKATKISITKLVHDLFKAKHLLSVDTKDGFKIVFPQVKKLNPKSKFDMNHYTWYKSTIKHEGKKGRRRLKK